MLGFNYLVALVPAIFCFCLTVLIHRYDKESWLVIGFFVVGLLLVPSFSALKEELDD